MLVRRLFGKSFRLFMPSAIANPVKETRSHGQKRREAAGKLGKMARRKVTDKTPSVDLGDAKGAKKKTREFLARQRKRVG